MNREEIEQLIPHRGPMLLLDHLEYRDGVSYGAYRFRESDWFLQGHFPDYPVVPGIVLCEVLAQSSVLCFPPDVSHQLIPFFTGLERTHFFKAVCPGDLFETECRLVKEKRPFFFFRGTGRVGDTLCLRSDFSIAVMDREEAGQLLGNNDAAC